MSHCMTTDTVERIASIMTAEFAWDLQYKEVVDVDSSKVTVCAEQVMSLVASITGEYDLKRVVIALLDYCMIQNLVEEHLDEFDKLVSIQFALSKFS